jgi:hypothetical protein
MARRSPSVLDNLPADTAFLTKDELIKAIVEKLKKMNEEQLTILLNKL